MSDHRATFHELHKRLLREGPPDESAEMQSLWAGLTMGLLAASRGEPIGDGSQYIGHYFKAGRDLARGIVEATEDFSE